MASASYQAGYSNSRALVIGIDSYADQRFVPLGKAEADANSMVAVLAAAPHNFAAQTLLGTQATRQAILQALFALRSTDPDDRALVYFAGHGYTLTDNFGNEIGYLAAADTIPEQDFTALRLDEVMDLRLHAGAKHISFIFDACYSGQALGLTRAPNVAADKFMQRRAYQVISAGAGDQTVSDYRSMTELILEALGSKMAESGLYTLSNLGIYLRDTMATQSGKKQIPQFGHLRGSQGGDMVFWTSQPVVELPPELQELVNSSLAGARIGAVHELTNLLGGSNIGMAQAAQKALEQLANDDSRRVSYAASDALGQRRPATQPYPVPSPAGKRPPKKKARPARPMDSDNALVARWWQVAVIVLAAPFGLFGWAVGNYDIAIDSGYYLVADSSTVLSALLVGWPGVWHIVKRRTLQGIILLAAAITWPVTGVSIILHNEGKLSFFVAFQILPIITLALTVLVLGWAILTALKDESH